MSVSVIGFNHDNSDGMAMALRVHADAHRLNGVALLNHADAVKAIAEGRKDVPKLSDPRPPYLKQEWPKHVYHADGRDKQVADKNDLKDAVAVGFRTEPYRAVRVAVLDPAIEKAKLQAEMAEKDGKIATLGDALATLTAKFDKFIADSKAA